MLSVMRNLGALSLGLTRPGLEVMGRTAAPLAGQRAVQRVALALQGKSLALRSVSQLASAQPGGVTPAASAPAKAVRKPPIEIRFQLKNGLSAVVRRVQADDARELEAFMRRQENHCGYADLEATWRWRSVDEHVWEAGAADHDALVAVVDGKIVALSTLNPEPGEMEQQKNVGFLVEHGLKPSSVCISEISVQPDMRSLGIGTVMKQAQIASAKQAGYSGVMSNTSHPAVKHIVSKLGGSVQPNAVSAWTLVKVIPDRKDE